MNRVNAVRGTAMCAVLFVCSFAFGASFTSTQSGDWSQATTWGGAGVPAAGDDVTITSNHVVTVTDNRLALTVTLDGTAGNKMLVVQTGGTLTIERALPPALTVSAPPAGSTNIVRVDGGTLQTSNSGVSITGGASNQAKIEFTANGGTARFAGDVIFAGTAANAVIDFGTSTGTLEIGGNLGAGGTITNSTSSTVVINGTSAQTIDGYTFRHFTVNKGGGTATLNGPIQINGDFTIIAGVLDDGGHQISLNGAGTSNTNIGGTGVLKLGSATTATNFPAPHGVVGLSTGSAVVYQAGVAQTIQSAFAYRRLYLSTLGGSASKTLSGASLTVNEELNIANNGSNVVTLALGSAALDANGDITGDGTVSLTSGTVNIAGNWGTSSVLSAGTSTITYDGSGAQQVLGATYHSLTIAKSASSATLAGNLAATNLSVGSGTLDAGANIVTITGDVSVSAGAGLNISNATVKLNGTAVQTISSAVSLTFGTLEINNPAGISHGSTGTTINTALNLNGGNVTVSSGNFFVDVLATVSRTSGWIVGELTMGMNATPARRFHVGTAAAYLPVDVDSASAGTVVIKAVEGKSPDRTAENVLQRYWKIVAPSSATTLDSITFNYNQSDVVTGDETKYILARYESATFTFTHYGAVNDTANTATAGTTSSYLGDWIIGQPGSLAAASRLAIVSINADVSPAANTPFDVVVQSQDDDGDATPVFDPTPVQLSLDNGTGTISGTLTGTVAGGSDTVTISGVEYDTAESNLIMRVARTGGDLLTDGTATFSVVSAPTTVTVSSINDNGAGTLRQAILDANSGACGNPCTINFSTSGEINLATPLPAITASGVTIDGYTAPGSSPNTNAFGQPSNAVITLAINGGNAVNVGFDIQATFVQIKGFAIKNFTNAGVVFSGDNSGSNVSGCYIGTDVTGTIAAPNAAGVHFSSAAEASLGGSTPAARNVISGNSTWGVITSGTANTIGIYGNYIGTKADLSGPLANNTGMKIDTGSSGFAIGGGGAGNVISGNTASGLVLAAGGNTVEGNYIGTAGSGNTAIPNSTGIQIDAGSNGNVIGGNSPSTTNTISGNTQNGILVRGNANTIDNNVIGIAPDGTTARGNGGSGIRLENNASGNLIGTSFGNKIAFNTNDGVTVATTSTGIGNVIRKGKNAGNGNRAIDLADDGATANDATDSDTGPNNLQNFPTVGSAAYGAGTLTVQLSLNSSGGVSVGGVIFDVYKADSGQPSLYLGSSACLAGNVFSNSVVNVATGSVNVGDNVVATATAYTDNTCATPSEGTSEVSAATTVDGDIHWINTGGGAWENAANWSPAVVPGANDNAIIDAAGTYTVTISSNVSIGALQLGAASGVQTLQINGSQSLSLAAASTVFANGILSHGGATLGGAASLSVLGTMQWGIGTISLAGGVTIQNAGTLNINSAGLKTLNGSLLTIASGATANWSGGQINFGSGGAVDNFGTFEVTTDSIIADSGSGGTFNNHGTFRKSTTAGTTTFSNIAFHHNAGTLDLDTGTLNLAGGTAAAAIAIDTNASLVIDDNTWTMNNGASMTGAGKIHVNGGTLAVNGAVGIERLVLDSGTLGGTGSASTTAVGSWVWNGGTMGGGGTTVIPNGATLTIGSASLKSLDNRTLSIQSGGTVTVSGTGSVSVSNGGNINNAGTVDNTVDTSFSNGGGGASITNTGLWQKSGGTTTSAFSNVSFDNSGTLKVLTGTVNPAALSNTGILEITGTLLIDDNTVTLGTGSDVNGTGVLRIAGGTLAVNHADTLPKVQIDSGSLAGTATHDITNLLWNGGTMSGTGTTNIPGGATATIASASLKSLQRTLSIGATGTVTVSGVGGINMSAGGTISNAGLFDITADMSISDGGSDGGITNSGTFRKSGGSGTTSLSNVDLTNSGTLDIQNGTLNPSALTNTGNIIVTGLLMVDDNTVTLNGGDVSGTGTVRIAGGTLDANATDTIRNVILGSGTLGGSGNLSIESFVWSGGTMTGTGTTIIPATATATIADPTLKSLQRTLSIVSGGEVDITGSGSISISSGGNIANDGVIEISSSVSLSDGGAGGDIVNTRTFRIVSNAAVTLSNITLDNNGASALVDIISGSLDLSDGTSSGAFAIGSGATLLVNSHTYTFATGTSVTGSGNVSLTNGTLSVTGNVSIPSLVQSGGTVDGAATLTLTGTSTWSSGTMQGGGTTTVAGGATLTLDTASAKTLNNRTLGTAAGGTINLTGTGSISFVSGGNIANGGNFNVSADNSISDGGSGGNFVNTGTFTRSLATGSTTFSNIGFSNNGGVVDLQRGILTVNGDAFTQSAAGTLKVWLGGTTAGSGFGQLATNTAPTLAGTLQIALAGQYQPVGGDTFRVVSASSRTGDFTQPYTYPPLANSRTFSDAWDASGLLLTVNGNGDLSITKGAPSNVLVGASITYTLSVKNLGPDAANSVSVTDVLQTGHSGISASGTGWSCTVNTLTVTCTAASLPVGNAPAITITATAPTTPQTFTNVANVSASNDPNAANDSGSAVVTVDPLQADLDVSASGPGAPHAQSSAQQIEFEIRNNGPQTASNVAFSATIPSTLTFNSATPDAGSCSFTFASGTLDCNLGNITASALVKVAINVTTTTAAGTHSIAGTATATEADPIPSNNSITFDLQVPGGVVTVTNVNDAGSGSLRQALADAGDGICTTPCRIEFNVPAPPYVVHLVDDLPSIADQVTIDGTSQPGYPANMIQIDGAANAVFAGLLLSGNGSTVKGLSITGFATSGVVVSGESNIVEANYIGLTPLGTAAGNGAGIEVSGNNNTIGGTSPSQRNVISGNAGSGVFLVGTATGNAVLGNRIGTDPAGTAARPNNIGVSVTGNADGNTIGGATAAHGNLLSGNTNWGVYLAGGGTVLVASGVAANAAGDGVVDGTVVRNNVIGPDANGTAALGALASALSVNEHAAGTVVQNNVLSGNANGITIDTATVTNTTITGNLIGVAPDGTTAMPNTQAGVVIAEGSGNSFTGNTIARNGGNGLLVLGGSGNTFLGNTMHDNTLLAIDVSGDGVSPNDPGDADGGPNGTQNSPNLTAVSLLGSNNVQVAYNLDSSAATPAVGSVRVEIFEADGAGEGKTFLAAACHAGNAFAAGTTFNSPAVAAGDPVVLTATSYTDGACTTVANGTSEFSNIVNASPCTPPAVAITGPAAVCAGGSVTLDAGSGFAQYAWNTGASTRTITVTPGSTTTYSVVVTDNIGCTNSDTHTVTVNPLPTATITGPTTMCAGGSVTLDAGAGFTQYLWSTGATSRTITVSPASTTTYSVTVTDGNTCQASDNHTVTVTATPAVNITGPTEVCAGTPVTLDAGPGFASYAWSTGATTQTIVVNPATTTTYTVTVGDGSCTATDNHTVTVNPAPVASITPSGSTTFCAGGSVTLTASNGTSWLWNTGATSQTITVSNSGTFSVQVFNGSCSASSAPVTVTVHPLPAVNITGPAATCDSAPVTLDAGPGFAQYLWSTGATSRTITVSPSVTSSYSVTVTDANGCSASDGHTVTVSNNPVAAINAPSGVCESATATASVAAQSGASYVWTVGNGTIAGGQGTNAITFTAGTSGNVTLGVTVTAGSCTSSGNVAVPIFTRPSAAISAPATATANQSGLVATVPPQTGVTYDWSIENGVIDSGNGTNTITFTAGASDVTRLLVTVSVGGCSESNAHHVLIDAPPQGGTDADLAITKSGPATVQPGGTITYTIGVTNRGPAAASDVVITDNFPAGTSFVSVTGGPWNCSRMNVAIRCTGVAAAGSSSVITLVLTAPQQSGTLVNTVDVFAATPDPNPGNNSASVTTSVVAAPPSCATAPPSLQLPAAGATVDSPVTFTWSAVEGATEYELWIGNALAGTTAATSATRALAAGPSSWFVVARLASGCDPLTSAVRTFTVAAVSSCPTQAPQITAPADGATASSPVTFNWTPVANAIGYRLWIEQTGTAPQDAGTTSGATSLSVALLPGTYRAYVEALFSGCAPVPSARVTVNIPAPDPCAARATASPLAPPNAAVLNSSSVDFSWTAAAGASGYRLWVSVDGADPAVLGITTAETSVRAAIPRGLVVWWIEALYDGCASTESARSRLTIPARNDCTDARPEPLAPAGNSQTANGTVTFAWSAVPNAVQYELWLAAGEGTPVLFATTAGTTLTRIVPPGRIDWFVVAVVDRCGPRQSRTSRFTYTPPVSCSTFQRPTLVAPLGGAASNAPVSFSWNAVAGAASYNLFVTRDGETSLVATTTATDAGGLALPAGRLSWFVRANFPGGCTPLDSAPRDLHIVSRPPACTLLAPPSLSTPGQISSGVPFLVQWTPVSGATSYQLQLASGASFADAQLVTTSGTEHQLVRTNDGGAPVAVYARVRAIDGRCLPVPAVSAYSAPSLIFILPSTGTGGSAPIGTGTITFTIPLGPELAGQTFTAASRQTWLTVSPASGVVGPTGTTLTVTANTASLPLGTSLGGVVVTLSSAAAGVGTNSSTTVSSNFSVSLVTPVVDNPKSTPPPDALIIPAVAHAAGINSQFQSDVRVSNTSAQLIDYLLTFTPSGDAGITEGQQTTFAIEPGQTIALDDVLATWFGTGTGSAMGTLEIRPLTQTATSTSSAALTGLSRLLTFASSRTFNVTANGTFGQYIPAIPFANFIGRAGEAGTKNLLSLQQIGQSSKYRTNLGLVEGSGESASLIVRVFGSAGEYLTEFPVSLKGGQHLQLNSFLRTQGIDSLSDGRVEVEVVSGGGKVTAYASVLDSETSDPLLVTPVNIDDAGGTKWVVPGVADLASGFANWQTDMRLFNAGTTDVEATLSFHSQSGGAPKVKTLTIPAGQVRQFDRTLASLFDTINDGGALHIATATPARLIATARTYNQTGNGTYGQFISAVTPSEAAGVGSRPLQLLQVEESDRFRSNVGLVEVTGKPVRIEISAIPPDAKFTAVTELELGPNEFRQLGSLLRSMGLADTYNARVTVRAVDGDGRVTAYASVIDMRTNDPTYIPAQ